MRVITQDAIKSSLSIDWKMLLNLIIIIISIIIIETSEVIANWGNRLILRCYYLPELELEILAFLSDSCSNFSLQVNYKFEFLAKIELR